MSFSIFVFLAAVHLAMIFYTDMKRMMIDSRHNRFMLGAAIFMFLMKGPGFELIILITIMTLGFGILIKKMVANADIEMASWAMIAFGSVSIVFLAIYSAVLFIIAGAYVLLLKKLKIKKAPGAPIFIGAFAITAALVLL